MENKRKRVRHQINMQSAALPSSDSWCLFHLGVIDDLLCFEGEFSVSRSYEIGQAAQHSDQLYGHFIGAVRTESVIRDFEGIE